MPTTPSHVGHHMCHPPIWVALPALLLGRYPGADLCLWNLFLHPPIPIPGLEHLAAPPPALSAEQPLHYRPNRTRTDDSLFVRQELYQLSYRPFLLGGCFLHHIIYDSCSRVKEEMLMKAFPYAVQLAKGRLRCALPDGIRHLAGRGGVALPCKPRPAKQASPEAAPRITVASLSTPLEAGVLMQPPCGGECRHRALRGCVDAQPHPSRKVHRG
jgi:hypothetical protein